MRSSARASLPALTATGADGAVVMAGLTPGQ